MNEVLFTELEFFRKIHNDCEIIFDIGCRDDVDYLKECEGKTFYMFEPNTTFYIDCKNRIDKMNGNTVHLYNFGISNKTGVYDYWDEYQSFFKRNYLVPKTLLEPHGLPLVKFFEFLEENKIKKIDFLKIDTEGGEPDILLDSPNFLKENVKYIQFEYGSTWIDRGDNIKLFDIIPVFKNDFNFYLLTNLQNNLFKGIPYSFLVEINNEILKNEIEYWVAESNGFEIIMINKKVKNVSL